MNKGQQWCVHKTRTAGISVMGGDGIVKVIKNRKDVDDWIGDRSKSDVVRMLKCGGNDSVALRLHRAGVRLLLMPTIMLSGRTETGPILSLLGEADARQLDTFRPMDASMVELRIGVKAYQAIQRNVRMPAQQRVGSIVDDLDILQEKDSKDVERRWSARFEDEVKQFKRLEAQIVKEILRPALESMPVWTTYLSDIRGIDYKLAAQIVAPIFDIRRFPRRRGLRKYFGRNPHNGALPKRRAGQKLGFNLEHRVVTHKIANSLVISKSPKYEPMFRARWAEEKEHHDKKCWIWSSPESKKDGTGRRKLGTDVCSRKGHILKRAKHWLACRFLDDLWEAWWTIEAGAPPNRPQPDRQAVAA